MKFRTLICTTAMTLFVALGLAGNAGAQTFTLLHSFDCCLTDGANPYAGLVQATNGELYGTTSYGGHSNLGTIFNITPTGTLQTLHSFDGTDGELTIAGLVQATNGNFYGTTYYGGANGDGTVFKITPSGTLTTLYSFCSQSGCPDGKNPYAALVQAANGNFYGTTLTGGAHGFGTIFSITPTGTLTTIHSLQANTDGYYPYAALVQGTDGNFYGTTSLGGDGDGTVFKITPSGTLTTLHSFGYMEGYKPTGALVQGADGNFYGTTEGGGTSSLCTVGCGTVFKITPSGTLTTLHSFDVTDGKFPIAGLVQATDGNFYGTTQYGGTDDDGTVFEITSAGTLTTLHSFDSSDGASPLYAALVQDTNGALYGTTAGGGVYNLGTVFSLSVGLGPFVETVPTSGKAGAVIKILGTNLTGATSVTFNGTPATFKVISPSEIGTTVPSGSTTGTVQVVTPSGTLSSNVVFRVTP